MRADADPHPTVTTTTGAVRGTRQGGVDRYLGIPYALPPFGERRFALPQAVPEWSDVRDAAEHGPTAPQDPYFGALGALLGSVDIPGDDILTANVWAPADAAGTGGALPVFVWYHGGALERGTPALPAYDGTTFARDGVVFVSIGYRVGAEGFSVLEGAPRNLGLSDAAAGLRWVRSEIARFGGDPERITIAGESAGGALVAALLSRPDTATIPVAAIIQSGPLEAVTPERAGRVTRALAKELGLAATREAFAGVSPRALLDARRRLAEGSNPLSGTPGYALAVDPETLPVSPDVALRAVDIPLVIGTNTDEYRLWFTPEQLAGISALKLTLARLATCVPRRAVRAYRGAHRPHLVLRTRLAEPRPRPAGRARDRHRLRLRPSRGIRLADRRRTRRSARARRPHARRLGWRGADRRAGVASSRRRTRSPAVRRPTARHRAAPRRCSGFPPGLRFALRRSGRARRRRPAGDRGG